MNFFFPSILLFTLCFPVNSQRHETRHSEGYRAMYDICGARTDGKVLNCSIGTPAVTPNELLSAKTQSLCPTITGNVCCTEGQFDNLRSQVQQAIPFLVGCPACLRNFLNLFCELTCSPNQSQFINVTSVARVGRNFTVNWIDFYITDDFGEKLFESCKDVKFGTINTRAIDLLVLVLPISQTGRAWCTRSPYAPAFRTYYTPLNKQTDYVNSMRAAREFSARISKSLKIDVFPYSAFYTFFEQYLDIWKMALINLSIAVGTVFIVCLVITCSFWTSAIILLVLVMIIMDLMAFSGCDGNPKYTIECTVVNLVMAVGIGVEFCVHITHAFLVSSGDRNQRMKDALTTMGASVFSGITLTKLVGVLLLLLCFSKSEVFVVYYFQMYLSLVLLGFLHGLIFLPVLLSMSGPPSRCILIEKQDDRPSTSSQY